VHPNPLFQQACAFTFAVITRMNTIAICRTLFMLLPFPPFVALWEPLKPVLSCDP
jgi:hypothetical protein